MPQLLDKARLGRLNALEKIRHDRFGMTMRRPGINGARAIAQFSSQRTA